MGNYRDDRTVRAVLFCCYSGDALLSEVISSSTYAPIGFEVYFQDEPILACGEVPEDVVWFERTCSQGFSMRIAYKSPNVLLGSNVWREVVLPVVLICILTCAAAYVISMRIYVPIQILRSCITDRSGSDDFALLRSTYNRISDENIFLRAQINDLKRRNVELEEQLASMTDQPDKKESTDNSSELLGYVQNHFRDPQLSLTMLAEHFNCTPSVISRRFRKETGYNFLEYLGSLRIEQAKALIINNPDISFDELAAVTGYGCERTFRRIFKTQTGLTPTVFAQQCRSGSYIVSELGRL